MTNNDILKKLRVALQLRDDEIVDILALVDFRISKSEIGAFCRKEGHPKYRECGDQVLRNFLNGLVLHLRGPRETPKAANRSNENEGRPKPNKTTGQKRVPTTRPSTKNKKGPKRT